MKLSDLSPSRLIKMPLRWKFILGPLFILFIFFVVVIFRSVTLSELIIMDSTLRYMDAEMEARAQDATQTFTRAVQDVHVFRDLPPVQGMIRAEAEGGYDSLGQSSYEEWQSRLQEIFASFARTHGVYTQIRYLDEQGDELVRVNYADGVAEVVQEEFLQNKGDRYYFNEALGLPGQDTYASQIDLNREGANQNIQVPYQPSIRYAVSVKDAAGAPQGVIVANIDAQYVIDQIAEASSNKRTLFVLDQEGYFLFHADKEKEWGNPRDLGHQARYHDRRPDIIDEVLAGTSGSVWSGENLVVFSPIYPNQDSRDRFLVLVEEVSTKTVTGVFESFRKQLVLGSALIFLGVAFGLLLFTRRLMVPLTKLQTVAGDVRDGDFNRRADISSKDEVGVVAQAFNEMLDTIQQYQSELEQKVQERTSEIERAKKDLEDTNHTIVDLLKDTQQDREQYRAQLLETKKFQEAVENATDGIIILSDQQKSIMYANRAFERLVGKHFHDIQNQSLDDLIDRATSDEVRAHVGSVFVENKTVSTENIFFARGSSFFQASASFFPIVKEHDTRLFVGIVQDITVRKEIDKAKTEFVSLASHQLRTPLSAINWYAEMLLSGDAGELAPEQRGYVEEIYGGSTRMVDLINALLNVSRIELGTFSVETQMTDIVKLLRSVLDETKPLSDAKRLGMVHEFTNDPLELKVDPKLLRMIFQNFISNAIKYTPEEGTVTVRLYIEDEECVFAVTDTGIGIPEAQQDHIFQKLFRADNAKAGDTEGTGLGLYIVKKVIDHSGGRTWFESEQDKGATFYATIPLSGMRDKEGSRTLDN